MTKTLSENQIHLDDTKPPAIFSLRLLQQPNNTKNVNSRTLNRLKPHFISNSHSNHNPSGKTIATTSLPEKSNHHARKSPCARAKYHAKFHPASVSHYVRNEALPSVYTNVYIKRAYIAFPREESRGDRNFPIGYMRGSRTRARIFRASSRCAVPPRAPCGTSSAECAEVVPRATARGQGGCWRKVVRGVRLYAFAWRSSFGLLGGFFFSESRVCAEEMNRGDWLVEIETFSGELVLGRIERLRVTGWFFHDRLRMVKKHFCHICFCAFSCLKSGHTVSVSRTFQHTHKHNSFVVTRELTTNSRQFLAKHRFSLIARVRQD